MARSSANLWCLSAMAALTLHAGTAVLAYSNLNAAEPNSEDGAPAMEISMAFEAPKLEPTDLPPGPEAEASTAAAASVAQTIHTEETPLPKDVNTQTEDPDRMVAEQDVKDPVEKDPEIKPQRSHASSDSVASEATAPPTIEATMDAPKATAPMQGAGQSATRVITSWQKKLVTHLDRNKRYPASANRRNVQVVVAFSLDRLGHVVASRIVQGSGDADFDKAALDMMTRADPVPPPPPLVADDSLTFTIPVVFRAKT